MLEVAGIKGAGLTLFLGSILLNIGEFLSMSGMTTILHRWWSTVSLLQWRQLADKQATLQMQAGPHLTRLPLTKMCSRCEIRPSCRQGRHFKGSTGGR